MRRAHVVIFGDVHNVGFRAWIERKANVIGVKGWVRNNSDGTVEVVFEAEDEKVEEMVEECKRGPPGSYVERIDVKEEKPKNEFKEFQIIL